MNVNTDLLAKQEWRKQDNQGLKIKIPTQRVGVINIIIQNELPTRLCCNEIYKKKIKEEGYKYWKERLLWEEGIETQVSWEALHISGLIFGTKIWIRNIKIASGHIPVASKLKQ